MPSANADGHTTRSGRNTQSAYAAPAGMKTGSAPQGTSKSDAVAMAQPADWNPAAAAGHKRRRVDSDGEDGTITPGPNTPATTNSGGTPSKPMKAEHGDAATATAGGGGGGGDKKKKRAAFTAEAASLGYETGTIKNSAFVLLAESGATGMTVAAIVEAATKQGLYSWGTCKTPNNSVTAALSQDTTFVRIAPSTYALRSTLKGGHGPVPQARVSSGSINSGAAAGAGRSNSGSGFSHGAVAGGQSKLGQNASSKSRKGEKQREQRAAAAAAAAEQMSLEQRRARATAARELSVVREGGASMSEYDDDDGGFPPRHRHRQNDDPNGWSDAHGYVAGGGYNGQSHHHHHHHHHAMGHYHHMAPHSYVPPVGAYAAELGNVSKLSSTLAMESYKRRMDVVGGNGGGEYDGGATLYQFTSTRPESDITETQAGSCLAWFPTANPPAPPADRPSPMKEPTEALIRASSWKDEAKSQTSIASPSPTTPTKSLSSSGRLGSGHLPKWVLESYINGTQSVSPSIAAA